MVSETVPFRAEEDCTQLVPPTISVSCVKEGVISGPASLEIAEAKDNDKWRTPLLRVEARSFCFVFVCGVRNGLQGLVHARQSLYH